MAPGPLFTVYIILLAHWNMGRRTAHESKTRGSFPASHCFWDSVPHLSFPAAGNGKSLVDHLSDW